MLKALTISCLLALACGAPAKKGCRIIGGQNAEPGQFKHQVSLQMEWDGWFHACGGSIISSKAVVTAASCYPNFIPISSMKVLAGSTNLESGGATYKIKSFTLHENYDEVTQLNDVAVIIVEGKIEFNDLVGPIKLASSNIDKDVSVRTSGWGYTSNVPGPVPNNLQWLETKTLSYEQCLERLGGWLFKRSKICTFTREGEGICDADTGGPLIKDGELHGITSMFLGCASTVPDVFTRVYSFVDWIEAHAQ